jgi:hypothetical protein
MACGHLPLKENATSTITIRLPDSKHSRLKDPAKSRNISVNKLIDEWATVALAQHDALAHFTMMQSRGVRPRLRLYYPLKTPTKWAFSR